MYITCLDLEGVLVPEIWIAFAEAAGIPQLKKTTRDEPDYDRLMDCQLERAAVTSIAGFAKLFPQAVKVLSLKKATGSSGKG